MTSATDKVRRIAVDGSDQWPYQLASRRFMLSPANHGRAIFMLRGSLLASAVNLNGPGRYLHWSIFIVSEANLVLIAVMVVIFGAALLIPFPGHGAGKQVVGSEDAKTKDADTPIGDTTR